MGPLGEVFLSPERRAGRRREVLQRARRDLQDKVQALRQAAGVLEALAGREPDTLTAAEARRLSALDAAAGRARRALSPPESGERGRSG